MSFCERIVGKSRKIPTRGASAEAKSLGAKSLSAVSVASGVGWYTLARWYRSRPALFRLVVLGYVAEGKS